MNLRRLIAKIINTPEAEKDGFVISPEVVAIVDGKEHPVLAVWLRDDNKLIIEAGSPAGNNTARQG